MPTVHFNSSSRTMKHGSHFRGSPARQNQIQNLSFCLRKDAT